MNKIKLFQTVADLHSQGKVELTASERNLIEQETADLIRKSQQYRTAMKAPEGFGDLLLDLAKMDADEAYERVVEFLKDTGLEVETEEEEKAEEEKEEKEESEDKDELPKPPEKEELEDKKELPKPLEDEKKEPLEDKKELPKPAEDKKEPPKPPFEKKPEPVLEKDEKEAKRKKLIAQAKELEEDEKTPGLGLGPGKGKGRGEGLGLERKRRLKELEEEDKKGQDMTDMGMSIDNTPIQANRAKKIKVRVTSSKNIVAVHEDLGPLFHAVPKDSVKKDINSLKRLANKVYGLIVYEGAEVAARKCGARLLAGADEDIETVSGDIPAATEGVTEEADFDTQETPDEKTDDSTKDAEFDTQETPDKVEAGKRQVARYKVLSGVEEDAEVVTEEKPEPKPDTSTEGSDDVAQEAPSVDPKDAISDADFDIKSVEANYKTLYQARAQKLAEKANSNFVKKFAKCIEIAATRMCHNMDEHPLKAAALDVLTSDNVAFSNSEVYDPMDAATATELIELFSEEGHKPFIAHLLNKTADLMEKSDEYLTDIYNDLEHLQPIPIQVEQEEVIPRVSNRKVARARNAARDGNVGLPLVSGGSAPSRDSNALRDAIGQTKVTRRLGSMGH